jgi:hypothetical protein
MVRLMDRPATTVLLLLIVSLLLATLASPAPGAEPQPSSTLEAQIAAQAIAGLPVDLRLGSIAIGPIDGDGDGRLAHALTGALTKLGRFKVIERRDLDKLLEEQGVQARDWIDPKERVKFGKVKGVQGLLFGRVLERSVGWLKDSFVVQLKLDDVERGQVVFAREFTARQWHVGPLVVLALVVLVVLVLILLVLGRKRTVMKKVELAEVDRKERRINTEELAKAFAELGRARGVLQEKGFTAEAIRVKDLEAQLRTLRDRIGLAPTGLTDRHAVGDLRQTVSFDQGYRTLVEDVTQAAMGLCDHVGNGDRGQVQRDLEDLTTHIREAEATFRNRRL